MDTSSAAQSAMFAAQNQAAEGVEHLHFNAAYRVREGEHAAVLGDPIFVGLRVGPEGLAFRCFTVNVKNDQDEAFLGFLDGEEISLDGDAFERLFDAFLAEVEAKFC